MHASGEPRRIGGATHVVGVMGWPVEHSLSPVIHNAAFAAMELDWVYVPMPVAPGRVRTAVDGLAALGFRGANVTMPHKDDAAAAVDVLDDDAALLRAVNTIVLSPDGSTRGANTDAPGFARFLADDAGFDVSGRAALVLGGGGAARACVLAIARAGAARITVAARNPAQLDAIGALATGTGAAFEGVAFDAAGDVGADLVVNATPVGRLGEAVPHPPLSGTSLVVDLLYHPAVTPLQLEAREAGADAFGGLGLLVHQAALSFELWTGTPAPLEVMSAAAVAAAADVERAGGA